MLEHRRELARHPGKLGLVELQAGQTGDVDDLFAFEHLTPILGIAPAGSERDSQPISREPGRPPESESKRVGKAYSGGMGGDLVRVRPKGQVTLPAAARKAAHLEVGAVLEVSVERGAVILRPKQLVDPADVWYKTVEWQAGERGADEELKRGQGEVDLSDDEFLASLDR